MLPPTASWPVMQLLQKGHKTVKKNMPVRPLGVASYVLLDPWIPPALAWCVLEWEGGHSILALLHPVSVAFTGCSVSLRQVEFATSEVIFSHPWNPSFIPHLSRPLVSPCFPQHPFFPQPLYFCLPFTHVQTGLFPFPTHLLTGSLLHLQFSLS